LRECAATLTVPIQGHKRVCYVTKRAKVWLPCFYDQLKT
jgi:hypothetical protein